MPKIHLKNLVIPVIWAVILLLNFQNFFFWDTIQLVSKHANYFYDNNFSSIFLPEEMDSGHPPFYGMMMAVWWKVFGRTLWVSHFLNFLFVMGLIFQTHLLGKKFLGRDSAYLLVLVIFANPIFLGHSILVSPDNLVMFLLIWSLNSILDKKLVVSSILMIFLSMISMRGMMMVFALFLGEIIYQNEFKISSLFQILKKYHAIYKLWYSK